MELHFKPGSEIAKAVQGMYEHKENMLIKAKQIIEEETGFKIDPKSGLQFIFVFDESYDWQYDLVKFIDEEAKIPGYKSEIVKENNKEYKLFRINKRTTVFNKIKDRFHNEITPVRSRILNKYGVKTEGNSRYYGYRLYKEDDGTISMQIHPEVFNLIDFKKSIENGNQTITVKQSQS